MIDTVQTLLDVSGVIQLDTPSATINRTWMINTYGSSSKYTVPNFDRTPMYSIIFNYENLH